METRVAFWIFACGIVTSAVSAAELRFESGEKQTRLIELYTSEGCSSCPAAETWLSKLKTDIGLWGNFVPVAFHVDYWDNLGWHDRFASRSATERQRAYAARRRTDSVYTPEFIVNGVEWQGWFNDRQVPNMEMPKVGILKVITGDRKTFAINFRPAEENSPQWDAHVVLMACEISSKIGAGENSGRKLQHDFVVLDHRIQPMNNVGGGAQASATIDLTRVGRAAQNAIAIWITRRDHLEPVQATGGWLWL